MYSGSDADYSYQRARAEQEARDAYDRSRSGGIVTPVPEMPSEPTAPVFSGNFSGGISSGGAVPVFPGGKIPVSSPGREIGNGSPDPGNDGQENEASENSGGIRGILSRIRGDDVLLIGLLLLLFNENKDDDPLILLVLALLLFT